MSEAAHSPNPKPAGFSTPPSRNFRPRGGINVEWEPASAQLEALIELASVSLGLPGITSLTIHSASNVEGYFFENTQDLVTLSFPELTSLSQSGFYFDSNAALRTISAPLLESIGATGADFHANTNLLEVDLRSLKTVGTDLMFASCTNLFALNLSSLETVSGSINGTFCSSLQSLSLPSLISATGDLIMSTCPGLASFSAPVLTSCATIQMAANVALSSVNIASFVFSNGVTVDFSGCALSAASVNHVLARAVANAGFTSGAVRLIGGTNAAPTGQGIVDSAALTLRGVTVTTN